MVWFAYGMQLVMVGLLANTIWRQPDVLVPTIGLGAGVLLWRLLPENVRSRPTALISIVVTSVLVAAVALVVADSPIQSALQRFWQDMRASAGTR
jgi:hypothetical protein